MRRIIVPSLTAALVLAFSAVAAAEGNDAKQGGVVPLGATSVPEPVPAQTQTTTSGEATTTATATAPSGGKDEARLKAIRDRAAKMPATDREEIQKKLEGNIKDVDVEAVANGDATVADRFAAEFGVTSEALLAERTQYNVGWGEVMIAHTLLANAPSGTTIDQLYSLHADGMGWGQVAYGMGLRVGSVAAAVKTETMVARGTMKADGKPAKIGANTRVASAGGAHAAAGQTRAGAASSAAMGVGVKVTK
ncbi:MAG TPA: hypothetical protein VE326_14515 [Candidatus Binatia bacterium]|nr:hypothetical protein [Candidatus Binatia bacterium]